MLPFRRPVQSPVPSPGRPPTKPFTVVDTTPPHAHTADDSFARYEEGRDEPINDRQRMLMNLIAVGIVVFLVSLGVWIADTIQISTQKEDCALQGRTNCEPIEVPARR